MNKYFNSYRKMISLRGLTDHTIKSYSTYILAYFDFLTDVIVLIDNLVSGFMIMAFLFVLDTPKCKYEKAQGSRQTVSSALTPREFHPN